LRIHDRFPETSLEKHAFQFHEFSKTFINSLEKASKQSWVFKLLKISIVLFAICLLLFIGYIIQKHPTDEPMNMVNSIVNTSFLLFGLLYFLFYLDKKYKRKRVSALLIKIKHYVHVVDMHQTNKDPNHFNDDYISSENSPVKKMTKFELQRYLDYVSEFVTLASKLSCLALAKCDDDQELISRINEVEALCNGISLKVWHKITILNSIE